MQIRVYYKLVLRVDIILKLISNSLRVYICESSRSSAAAIEPGARHVLIAANATLNIKRIKLAFTIENNSFIFY